MSASGFSGRLPPGPQVPATPDRSVTQWLQNPMPTVLPQNEAGAPALPLPQHMVAGSPYPHSAQTKLAHWNRATGSQMPAGVTFNAPRNRMVQT